MHVHMSVRHRTCVMQALLACLAAMQFLAAAHARGAARAWSGVDSLGLSMANLILS